MSLCHTLCCCVALFARSIVLVHFMRRALHQEFTANYERRAAHSCTFRKLFTKIYSIRIVESIVRLSSMDFIMWCETTLYLWHGLAADWLNVCVSRSWYVQLIAYTHVSVYSSHLWTGAAFAVDAEDKYSVAVVVEVVDVIMINDACAQCSIIWLYNLLQIFWRCV